MSRPICVEDVYEYRVKLIFERLREAYAGENVACTFDEWLTRNCRGNVIATAFIDDVDTYMGIPESVEES